MTTARSLDQLRPGQRAIVRSLGGGRALRRRLMEMGLLPGTEVKVLRAAPLLDPIELEVRGYRLSIRLAEAALVALERSTSAHGDSPSERAA